VGKAELLIGGLLMAIAGLGALARRLSIPYPIVLVVGGVAFGFIPGVPTVKLDPNISGTPWSSFAVRGRFRTRR